VERTDISSKDKSTSSADRTRAAGGPLALMLPPDPAVLAEARRLVGEGSTRMDELAVCASQDPVVVIELLRVANAMYFSEGRPPITSVKTAAIRLGADVLLETFDKLAERASVEDPEVSRWFELHRVRCKRASIVSSILSEALARPLLDECQVAALLMFVGEMIAVMHLKERYTKLANEASRSALLFRLAQDFKFDVESMSVSYLRRHGTPEGILMVLDRDSVIRAKDRVVMKPICMAAGELVDAFDQNRLDKLAPGKQIPPKSALRILMMSEPQYLKVYERVSEFLFSFRVLEERKQEAARKSQGKAPAGSASARSASSSPSSKQLQTEIQSILDEELDDDLDDVGNELDEVEALAVEDDDIEEAEETQVEELDEPLGASLKEFNLRPEAAASKTVARVATTEKKPEGTPIIHTKKGTQFLSDIAGMLGEAKTSQELLAQILAKLVTPGPFEKAAIIVVSKDRKKAIVVACRGPALGGGQTLSLDDPLNPLAQCLSRVQSYGRNKNNVSPFGSRAFAVAPLDADHDTPVALYADCGKNGALTFESRRIFRAVVGILNKRLPTLPGGIPVEVSDN